MDQYFVNQPYEINGVMQKKFFLIETHLGDDPEGGQRVRLEVIGILASEVANLSKTHLFVRMHPGAMPVLRLK